MYYILKSQFKYILYCLLEYVPLSGPLKDKNGHPKIF